MLVEAAEAGGYAGHDEGSHDAGGLFDAGDEEGHPGSLEGRALHRLQRVEMARGKQHEVGACRRAPCRTRAPAGPGDRSGRGGRAGPSDVIGPAPTRYGVFGANQTRVLDVYPADAGCGQQGCGQGSDPPCSHDADRRGPAAPQGRRCRPGRGQYERQRCCVGEQPFVLGRGEAGHGGVAVVESPGALEHAHQRVHVAGCRPGPGGFGSHPGKAAGPVE